MAIVSEFSERIRAKLKIFRALCSHPCERQLGSDPRGFASRINVAGEEVRIKHPGDRQILAMKLRKTKTEITIETHQRVTVRANARRAVWCQKCGSNVSRISPEHAALPSKTTLSEIHRRIARGELHLVETRGGDSLVCAGSFKID